MRVGGVRECSFAGSGNEADPPWTEAIHARHGAGWRWGRLFRGGHSLHARMRSDVRAPWSSISFSAASRPSRSPPISSTRWSAQKDF